MDENPLLFVEDIQEIYHTGKSKAHLILNQVPGVIRIGKRKAIRQSTLEMHLKQHGGIDVK